MSYCFMTKLDQFQILFQKIHTFLTEHFFLIQNEPLFTTTNCQWQKYNSYTDELLKFDSTAWKEIFQNKLNQQYSNELTTFLQEIHHLSELNLPSFDYDDQDLMKYQAHQLPILNKVNQKKKYELFQMIHFFQNAQLNFQDLFDIGSGHGHFSQFMHYFNICHTSYNFDFNMELQITGKAKVEKHLPQFKHKINYIHQKIDSQSELIPEKSMPLHQEKKLLFGLHTCGELACHLMGLGIKNKINHLFNIGCCYHKMKNYIPLSHFVLEQGLNLALNPYSLNLASHASYVISEENVHRKNMIREYRYGLHLYLLENHQQEIINIGGNKKPHQSYLSYLEEKSVTLTNEFKINLNIQKALMHFEAEENQRAINRLIILGLFRSLIGKIIENYILLDRYFYLKEHYNEVMMGTIFKPQISPKNIFLFARQ